MPKDASGWLLGSRQSGVVPGWATKAFDPHHARTAKTASSGLRQSLASAHGGIALTNVGQELIAYWHGARGDNPVPATSDISPKNFHEILPYARYMSWDGPEDLRIRVFGSALSTAFGMDLTGFNLLDLFEPETLPLEVERFRALHAQPCGSVTVRHAYFEGGSAREIELVHLPVRGHPSRILGTVMVREIPERWNGEADRTRPMDTLDFSYIDVGFGIPGAGA
ncbi:PAS domain-containing protein [Pyruvatibacter sp.]|uniref:PAS domain-containing protein n=1 Tax=Pyruvatibacter sp. TaxID=1981328 RepID=UPI0032EB33F9